MAHHHRSYCSVHGVFNSWHALTDRLRLNHKSPILSVSLLLALFWPHLYLPFSNKLFSSGLLHRLPIPASPALSTFVFGSSAISTVSRYTSVSFYTTIHLTLRCFSSCLPHYNVSAILAYILLFAPWLSLYFRTYSGKWAFAGYPWLSSMTFHGHGLILSILVYTLFSRMFDLTQPPVVKHSIAVA